MVRGTPRQWLEAYRTGRKTAADGIPTTSPLHATTTPIGAPLKGETLQQWIARLEARVVELEAEQVKLTTEREILRKAATCFAGETRW